MCQNSLIFWATKNSVGKIDILTRKVSEFKSRLKTIRKIKATRNGGLAVQREKDLLSLFINDKEIPQILQKPLIDFFLDENSDSQRGLISFILSNNDILVYPYDKNGFQKLTGKFKINNNDAIPRSLSINKNDICISFDNGTIILFTIGQQNSTRIVTTMKDIYYIQHLDYPQGVNRSVSNESMKYDDSSCENLSSISLNDDNNQLNLDEPTTDNPNEEIIQNKPISNDSKSDKTQNHDKNEKISKSDTNHKSDKNVEEISNDKDQISSMNGDKNRINLRETKINHDKQNKRSERRVILGISEKNELFILDKRVRICPIPVLMASPCGYDNDSVLALCTDGVTRLIRLKDWQPYSKLSSGISFLSPPKIDNFNRNKIVNYESEYLRFDSFEIRNAMKSNPPLSVMLKYSCGSNTLQVPKTLLILLEKITKSSQKIEKMKFNASLFSDDFEKASDYLLSIGPNSNGFVKNAALSGCLVSSNLQNEKFIAHLKSIASSLFLANRFEDGSLFMRIIKNDYAAADYLIEVGQLDMAKSFIYLLGKEEKKSILSKMALFLYKKGDKKESICLFLSAEEFHPALCVMQELNMVLDSYHIKKIAEERGLLKQTENKTLKQIISLFDFETLCTKIDMDYTNICTKLGII
ncbi:hypothetical protein TVAG_316830 [Trichomonas vaginalis G3]|uniref:Uncharacterized protein n=1 Tax=Trichomonas vaginalis (strain ATCC PRA-98 / G3) TaxID=412133 RepID=A2F061_TRIV3|nr:hypothetical protein TVAGG3_0985530 [Trichomonas vaginalis G3]EAY01696.1 hypothetical protein TVAG_316830 [Trichomonas vaginalis G3]KAI5489631.1 hypothetical protein TVAGG3_0985530 [Trichomonas vaginalis G3]|eukprot:XP_001330392.1 hypothetical protein [Trichomonas vaginalis G3]